MKRSKRGLALVLALVLMLGLTACGGKKQTPQDVYNEALAKLREMSSLDGNMEMTMSMTDGTEALEISMESEIKIQDLNKESMLMDMKMSIGMMGISMDLQTYYVDGYFLMDMMGQKVKYKMPLEEAVAQASVLQEMDTSAMGEINMEEKDGIRTLTYQVDVSKMSENMSSEEYLGILENLGLGDMAGDDMTYDLIEGSMTVDKNGNILTNQAHMTGTTDLEGTKLSFEMEMTITYNNPGQAVTVEAPDASEYMEIDSPAAG
ncbi:MAG: hypothetical protein HFI38_13465 [Lachnospiraceae bacterium]|jgi:uncharacterized lipoprotein YehR (DUF1307 family)|nr:hypothetical protein [Lachnospiraceae bacterium]